MTATAFNTAQEHIPSFRLGAVGRRLGKLENLPERDREVLIHCMTRTSDLSAGYEIIPAGATMDAPKIVVSGWVCLSRSLLDGRRQIIDVFLPGDLVGYCSMPNATTHGSYQCLTDARCADGRELVQHLASGAASDELCAAVRGMEFEFQSRIVENMLRAGRMLSHERLAHLVLDLYHRHERIGMVAGDAFPMPLTQETVGDAIGMSAVHVNRTLQFMRREQILKTSNGRWHVLDLERLMALASGREGRESHRNEAAG